MPSCGVADLRLTASCSQAVNASSRLPLSRRGLDELGRSQHGRNCSRSHACCTAMGVDHGALVVAVIDSGPAAAAGVRQGDVIVKVQDAAVGSVDDLIGTLRREEVRRSRRRDSRPRSEGTGADGRARRGLRQAQREGRLRSVRHVWAQCRPGTELRCHSVKRLLRCTGTCWSAGTTVMLPGSARPSGKQEASSASTEAASRRLRRSPSTCRESSLITYRPRTFRRSARFGRSVPTPCCCVPSSEWSRPMRPTSSRVERGAGARRRARRRRLASRTSRTRRHGSTDAPMRRGTLTEELQTVLRGEA